MLNDNEYVLDNILDKVVPNVHVMLPNIYVGLYICWVTTADICWVYMLDTHGICMLGTIEYMLGIRKYIEQQLVTQRTCHVIQHICGYIYDVRYL